MGKSLSLTEFIALIAFLFSLIAIGTDMMLPALGIIAVDLNLQTENHAQLIITVFLLGTGLGQLISGPISDTYGRKIVLCTGISLFILASIAAIITSDFLMLLIARFIQGLGISAPRAAGMDQEVIRRLLESDADIDDIKARDTDARKKGIQGVPAFVVANEYVVQGAQTTDVWNNIIKEIQEAQ